MAKTKSLWIRMPIMWKGRDTNLLRLRDRVRKEKLVDPEKTWELVKAHRTGNWYSITDSAEITDVDGIRLRDCIRMRRYMDGYNSQDMSCIMTRKDGLCFCWKFVPEAEKEEREAARLVRKKERLQKHVLRNLERRKTLRRRAEVDAEGGLKA